MFYLAITFTFSLATISIHYNKIIQFYHMSFEFKGDRY